ncbi:DUF808 domain-containing protein [Sphingomonas sp.]|uniref:DUF808 domain-containing protein n=1 Tax=Sphingomonas sp. TaxID=28214 RepID=UPI002B7E85EA|nr:DUF808 domain-containing protein [Sphingomonas sp.]HTG37822.1 DUF808 domain-containing protein [Sphingomonas sp.]
MASGLIALLDDVAAIARLAAASVDDIGAAAGKAGAKAAGVVIDDAAVTPSYVTGLSPQRELPIIGKIGIGSLRNKLLILLPAALLLSAFAQWAIMPILMLGGAYLSFEGVEKLIEKLRGESRGEEAAAITDPAQLEARQVSGAIRTDLILSAEIMAITLAELPQQGLWMQGAVLAVVGIAITLIVYGVVALIVKMDDIGLHLVDSGRAPGAGRALVSAMPVLLRALAAIGTAAMIWVGGGIVVHGLATFGVDGPEHLIHDAASAVGNGNGLLEWLVTAIGSGVVGIATGLLVVAGLHLVPRKAH